MRTRVRGAAELSDVLGEPLDRNVGGKTAEAMAEGLDLHTVGDLLDHFPRRYVERGELTSLDDLVAGELVTIQAEVVKVSGRRIRHKLHKTRRHRQRRTRHAHRHVLQPALAREAAHARQTRPVRRQGRGVRHQEDQIAHEP